MADDSGASEEKRALGRENGTGGVAIDVTRLSAAGHPSATPVRLASHSGGESMLITTGIAGNVVTTVGIILVNKYLFNVLQFHFMATLTCLHFITTSLGMQLLLYLGYFEYKPRPLLKVLPVALGCVGSVAFGNLSLATNSVGFYQLAKLLCIPVTLMAEYALYRSIASARMIASLVIMLIGVGLATVSDVSANVVGTTFAALAVACTVFSQMVTQSRQTMLELSSVQLLHMTAPWTALGLLPLIFIFDDVSGGPESLQRYPMSTTSLGMLLLSCLFAVGCNVTNFLVIGKTSPVTYQVVGHFKTILILVFGFIVFHYPVVLKNILGITLAMVGVILYGEVKRRKL